MVTEKDNSADSARLCLIRAAGWATQDFGMGRIVGEVFAFVYLSENAVSLDEIADSLNLSKAAISIATRQLDKLSLIVRVKNQGDRKIYYRTSDHFAYSLKNGILELIRTKLKAAEDALDQAESFLKNDTADPEKQFLMYQIDRARKIRNRADKMLNNPLLKLFT
jgi:DNA-binding transcriptional regulator GbsR (MarR family)